MCSSGVAGQRPRVGSFASVNGAAAKDTAQSPASSEPICDGLSESLRAGRAAQIGRSDARGEGIEKGLLHAPGDFVEAQVLEHQDGAQKKRGGVCLTLARDVRCGAVD